MFLQFQRVGTLPRVRVRGLVRIAKVLASKVHQFFIRWSVALLDIDDGTFARWIIRLRLVRAIKLRAAHLGILLNDGQVGRM